MKTWIAEGTIAFTVEAEDVFEAERIIARMKHIVARRLPLGARFNSMSFTRSEEEA